MAAIHDPSNTEQILFKNDANNSSALEDVRAQNTRLEEVAHLQQNALSEAAAKLQNQIKARENAETKNNELEQEMQILNQAIEQKNSELKQENERLIQALERRNGESEKAKADISALRDSFIQAIARKDDEIRDMQNAIRSIGSEKEVLEEENQDYESKIRTLTNSYNEQDAALTRVRQEVKTMSLKLPGDQLHNCLPLNYHNAIIMIINSQTTMALDHGKGKIKLFDIQLSFDNNLRIADNGTRACLWPFNPENENQMFRLIKTGRLTDPSSPWVIERKTNYSKYTPIEGLADRQLTH